MPATKTAAIPPKPEDEATGDVKRGMTKEAIPMTEDQRRASGIDAGADAGPHSFDPADNKTNGGTVLDTYAGMPVGGVSTAGRAPGPDVMGWGAADDTPRRPRPTQRKNRRISEPIQINAKMAT